MNGMFLPNRRRSDRRLIPAVMAVLLLCCAGGRAIAQSQVVDVTVHSAGLEHNLLGDPADQPVSIYLPAAYFQQPQRRLPVLYFLHGYADPTPRHQAAEQFRKAMDQLLAKGSVQPLIVVLPNGINKYYGAFYANSTSTGQWDDYITRDVVGYTDRHYRTEADPEHRTIAGHSMGGYGALTLAFRHPEVFGFVYALSPCCTDLVGDFGSSNAAWASIGALTSPEQVGESLKSGQFFVAADSALMAALAPDPASKIFGDAPFVMDHGQLRTDPAAYSRIAANMPANMIVPLLPSIARLKGIAMDYGAQDNFSHISLGVQEISERLSRAGISHTLEVYQGDHGSRIPERISEHLLPWASQHMAQ